MYDGRLRGWRRDKIKMSKCLNMHCYTLWAAEMAAHLVEWKDKNMAVYSDVLRDAKMVDDWVG